ncbi:MAG: 50S ribosomal protein L25 [Myxococcota bacterium]
MAENALTVELRDQAGKGVARKLRAVGRIPGVCYGKNEHAVPISLDAHALKRLLDRSEAGMNTIINLSGGGDLAGKQVLVRELQRDPVRGQYLHADLYAVDVKQKVDVSVPIHIEGKPVGVEMGGGVLDHALRELELTCLPLSIPKEIVVDVTELVLGQSLHVRDILLPEGVELRSDGDLSVVSVVAASKAEEEVPVEAEAEEGEEAAAEGAEGAAPSEEPPAEEKSGD